MADKSYRICTSAPVTLEEAATLLYNFLNDKALTNPEVTLYDMHAKFDPFKLLNATIRRPNVPDIKTISQKLSASNCIAVGVASFDEEDIRIMNQHMSL